MRKKKHQIKQINTSSGSHTPGLTNVNQKGQIRLGYYRY